jgi:diguanylate cyclase (GGDEF)-like protein
MTGQGLPGSLDEVLSRSSHGAVTLDRTGGVLWCNDAAQLLLGLFDHGDGAHTLGELWTVVPVRLRAPQSPGEASYWTGEWTRRGGDGLTRTLAVEVVVHRDARGVPHELSALVRDVSEAQRLHRELLHQASHDPLTGLANRARFRRVATEAVERLRRNGGVMSVLFVDLDRLKEINDVAGHDVGDRVIVHAGQRLAAAVRPTDVVARLGGDEFVALCESVTDSHSALEIAERLRRAICERHELDGRPVTLGASVGVAVLDSASARSDDRSDSELADSLLQQADSAMYRAKERGRNRCELFDEELGSQVQMRRRRGDELADALGHQRLHCRWTPLVDLTNDVVTGWMLGATWRTPDGEELGHHEIVELAARAGLGRGLRDWLMRQTTSPLPGAGRRVVLVPWSAAQLRDPDAVDTARSVLAANDDVRRLVVCVDEVALTSDDPDTERTLRSLPRYGLGLCISGVGGGATPLRRLAELPVERLILHPRLVADLGTSRAAEALTGSLIQVGHALDVVVSADVGTGDVAALARRTERLRTLGCDEVIGRRADVTVDAQELTAN